MREYRAFGMHIESELMLDLPELLPHSLADGSLSSSDDLDQIGEDVPEWRVSIGLGCVKSDPSLPLNHGRIRFGESGDDLQVEVPWAGRYRVRGDSRIDVEPAQAADARVVSLYITGYILSFLLRRHAFLTLHGSAVSGPSGALLFLGERGSGKSTIATAMTQAGYRILCDDVIPMTKGPVVLPGIPVPKLLPDSYEYLIGDTAAASLLFDGVDKYQVKIATCEKPTPLHAIFILEPANVHQVMILPLTGGAKIAALLQHISSIIGIDDSRDVFTQTIRLLGNSQVFRIRRPIGAFRLQEMIEAIVLQTTKE